MRTIPIITMFDSNYVIAAAGCFASMVECFARDTAAPLSPLALAHIEEISKKLSLQSEANTNGSKSWAFAHDAVLSVPSTRANGEGRSEAKSAEGTKTNGGGGKDLP